jgi:hypothetical protein
VSLEAVDKDDAGSSQFKLLPSSEAAYLNVLDHRVLGITQDGEPDIGH